MTGATVAYTNITGGTNKAPFGGFTLIIGGVAYRSPNFKPEATSRKIRRNDTNGDQAEVMRRAEPRAQSGLTLQLATALTPPPSQFDDFTDPSDGFTQFVITKVGVSYPEGEFWFCDIDIESDVATGS